MKTMGWLVCSAFIEKKGAQERKTLMSFLSQTQKEQLDTLPIPPVQLCEGLLSPQDLIEWVHPSWITLFLRSCSQEKISLFLSALPENITSVLQKNLLSSFPRFSLSKPACSFLQNNLIKGLIGNQTTLLPKEALPLSPLQDLFTLSSVQLSLLVSFLGLYDLTLEIRQIIDTIRLKKIYHALSKEKKAFLQFLSQRKASVIFKRIDLSEWKGDAEELLTIVYKRGMNRLAKALYTEQPSFVWYITRRMNSEDAHLFFSLHKKLDSPQAYALLTEQVEEVLSFLRTYNLEESV